MHRNILFALLITALASGLALAAEEPKELQAAKKQFEAAPHPDEAARAQYVTSLAKLRQKLAKSDGNWQAVDAEVIRHPVPATADSKALSKLRVGKWTSPRHDYLYRSNGTWTMLPADPETTHGVWHIDGNQYFDGVTDTPSDKNKYTLILLTAKDFIFTDGEMVFYETRSGK